MDHLLTPEQHFPATKSPWWVALPVWATILFVLVPVVVAEPPYAGRALDDVLLELQASGLRLVFTSSVVKPWMRVMAEPSAGEPEEVLADLLAAHGLTIQEGPGGALMVVLGEPPATAIAAVTGRVSHRTSSATQMGKALAGVEILDPASGQRATTDLEGRFLLDLAPGPHVLQVRHTGYLPQEAPLTVIAGLEIVLEIELSPVPVTREEISIDASRWSFLGEGPSTLVLDQERLGTLPALAEDPYRILTLFPGTTGNDISSRVSVRGGLPTDVMVRIDGLEVFEPFHLQDFGGALSILAPTMIANAELKRGGYRADFGERLGGVLVLTTTTPQQQQTRLGLSWLSLEASRSSLLAEDRGSYLVSLRVGSLQPSFEVTEEREKPSFADAFVKAEYRLRPGRSLLGYVLHSRDRFDFVEGEDEEEERRFRTNYLNAYVWADHQAVLERDRFVETRLAWSVLERDRDGAERDSSSDVRLQDRRRLDILSFAHTRSWGSGKRQLRAGLEARWLGADFDYRDERSFDDPLAVLRGERGDGSTRFDEESRGSQTGVWLSGRWQPRDPLEIELGLRFDTNTLTQDRHLSPRLNLAYKLGNRDVVRLAWGLFHQSQRPDELQVADGETGLFPSERSEHRILGYERDFAGPASLILRVEAYQYRLSKPRPRYENLLLPLSFLPELEADRARIAPQDGRSEGIELFLRGAGGSRLDWWLGSTWSRVTDRIAGRDTPRGLDQPTSVQVGLNVRGPRRWGFHLGWRWHTGWPTTSVSARLETADGSADVVPIFGPLYGERLADYRRLDAKASRPFTLRRGELEFYFEVQNLLNKRNAAGFEIEFEETSDGRVDVQKESKRWAGVLPLAGVRWVF